LKGRSAEGGLTLLFSSSSRIKKNVISWLFGLLTNDLFFVGEDTNEEPRNSYLGVINKDVIASPPGEAICLR